MIPTMRMTSIFDTWRDAITADYELLDYCENTLGKPLTLFVGYSPHRPPTEKDCPYIILTPGGKLEGAARQEEYTYQHVVGWSVLGNKAPKKTGIVYEVEALKEGDIFGQHILRVLDTASPGNNIDELDYELNEVDYAPQVVGQVAIKIGITPCGEDPTYLGGDLVG